MKYFTALGLVIGISAIAFSQQTPAGSGNSLPGISYASVQFIAPGDSAEVVAEKAAKVLPRPNQTTWMRLEQTFFIHFGPNTFRGVEWGNGREDPSIFNPSALDASQWVAAVKEGGGRMIIPVVKHAQRFETNAGARSIVPPG